MNESGYLEVNSVLGFEFTVFVVLAAVPVSDGASNSSFVGRLFGHLENEVAFYVSGEGNQFFLFALDKIPLQESRKLQVLAGVAAYIHLHGVGLINNYLLHERSNQTTRKSLAPTQVLQH